MNKIEIWILLIIVFLGLIVVFLGVQMTGQASKHLYTVMYRSCHYLDYDARGECVRIERQNSNHCSPEETIPDQLTGTYGKRPMNWFYRTCETPGRLSW